MNSNDASFVAGTGIDTYFRAVAELQHRVLDAQRDLLANVAAKMADVILANGGVPGDGIVSIPGLERKVGPTSTVMGAIIWNALVVETTHRIQIAKGDAPVGVSFNMPGYAEYAKALEKKKDFNLAPMHL